MLVEGALKQRYAFTAYAVNSYIEPDVMARGVAEGRLSLLACAKIAESEVKKVREVCMSASVSVSVRVCVDA